MEKVIAMSRDRGSDPNAPLAIRPTRSRVLWLVLKILACTFTLAVPSRAQARFHPEAGPPVVGQVVDTSGEGVAGVDVIVEGTERRASTDATGSFQLTGVAKGSVTLSIRDPAYEPIRREVSRTQRRTTVSLQVTRVERNPYSVTVVSSRNRPQTASTTRISPRDITAAPRRNAEDILRQVPGMTLVQHGSEGKGHQFLLRGFDAIHGSDFEVTLDGLPINEWSNVHAQGYLDLGLIIPEAVSGVDVQKGPFTLEQGAFAMAGSADYRLGIAQNERGWRASYTSGTTNRHRLFAGFSRKAEDDRDFLALEATHDDGFGHNRGIDRMTFNGRVTLLQGRQFGELSLLAAGSYAAFELPGTLRNVDVEQGLIGFYDTYDETQQGRSGRALVALLHRLERGRHALEVNAYASYRDLRLRENFTGFLIDPEHGDRRAQLQRTWPFGLSATYLLKLVETLSLHTGLGLRVDHFAQTEQTVGRDLEATGARRDLLGDQLIAHTRVGLRWQPVQQVRVDIGTRADVIHVGVTDRLAGSIRGSGTSVAVSPRATVRLQVVKNLGLFAAYGRGFRPPEARAYSAFDPGQAGLSEDVYDGGEPAITISDALEVGTRWRPARWFDARVAGFATLIARESVYDHVSGVSLELNGSRRLGGELILTSLPLSWLRLSADLTLVDARFSESGNRVPFAPWLTSGGRITITHRSGFRGGLRALGFAPRPLPHGATGSTQVRLDATLGYDYRWLRIALEVENLLNRQLRDGEYHYASNFDPDSPASALPVLHTVAGPPLNARLTVGFVF